MDEGLAGEVLPQGDIFKHGRPSFARGQRLHRLVDGEDPGVEVQPHMAQRQNDPVHLGHIQPHGRQLLRVGEDLRRRTLHGDGPVVHDEQPVSDGRHVLHAVGDHQDGRVLRLLIGADVL